MIWDATFFDWLEPRIEDFIDLDPKVVLPALERACAIKAEVRCPRRTRGGTSAAAQLRPYPGARDRDRMRDTRGILHGEAVSIGMVFCG